jgi:hypothetical protein
MPPKRSYGAPQDRGGFFLGAEDGGASGHVARSAVSIHFEAHAGGRPGIENASVNRDHEMVAARGGCKWSLQLLNRPPRRHRRGPPSPYEKMQSLF